MLNVNTTSNHLFAHLSRRFMDELIEYMYQWGWRPSVRKHFEIYSPLKSRKLVQHHTHIW